MVLRRCHAVVEITQAKRGREKKVAPVEVELRRIIEESQHQDPDPDRLGGPWADRLSEVVTVRSLIPGARVRATQAARSTRVVIFKHQLLARPVGARARKNEAKDRWVVHRRRLLGEEAQEVKKCLLSCRRKIR